MGVLNVLRDRAILLEPLVQVIARRVSGQLTHKYATFLLDLHLIGNTACVGSTYERFDSEGTKTAIAGTSQNRPRGHPTACAYLLSHEKDTPSMCMRTNSKNIHTHTERERTASERTSGPSSAACSRSGSRALSCSARHRN
jgi:hypothetical protein